MIFSKKKMQLKIEKTLTYHEKCELDNGRVEEVQQATEIAGVLVDEQLEEVRLGISTLLEPGIGGRQCAGFFVTVLFVDY